MHRMHSAFTITMIKLTNHDSLITAFAIRSAPLLCQIKSLKRCTVIRSFDPPRSRSHSRFSTRFFALHLSYWPPLLNWSFRPLITLFDSVPLPFPGSSLCLSNPVTGVAAHLPLFAPFVRSTRQSNLNYQI